MLEMTIAEAGDSLPATRRLTVLDTLNSVGLGYISLGQTSTTLSGGEAQRIKLATELHCPATGRTLYLLDEPTTGLHMADIERLLAALQALVDHGNTVAVIEHNADVIKVADHIIDMGPEGGEAGGFSWARAHPRRSPSSTRPRGPSCEMRSERPYPSAAPTLRTSRLRLITRTSGSRVHAPTTSRASTSPSRTAR